MSENEANIRTHMRIKLNIFEIRNSLQYSLNPIM